MLFEILSTCKGGGYRYCRTTPLHPNRNKMGLYPLHRVILENKLNRLLKHEEIAHHVDGNKENNSEDNIALIGWKEHSKYHQDKSAPLPILLICACGKHFSLKPGVYRTRIGKNKTHIAYCSSECSGRYVPITLKRSIPILLHCVCGTEFSINPRDYRRRIKRSKSGTIYCSRVCSGNHLKGTPEQCRKAAQARWKNHTSKMNLMQSALEQARTSPIS